MRLIALVAVALVLLACGGSNELEAVPTEPPVAQRDSIAIPALGVEAPLSLKTFQPGAALPSPDGPYDVVLYDFGSMGQLGGAPGEGGNAVLSGRSVSDVGCISAEPPCNGVFVRLRHIALGDRVDLSWRGSDYRYQVVSVCGVLTTQFSDRVYQRTAAEQLTLLTGLGTTGGGFPVVLVIIAKPAPVTAAEPCPPGTAAVVPP